MKSRTVALVVLVLLVWGGLALRLYRLNVVPLRGDEAFTVLHWMREPFSQTLAEVATTDPQPPLAYLTYRLYALLIGSDEYRVRFLPALLNTLGIPALYALGKRVGGRRLGLLAALLYALNPNEIWHAQDARNYAIWAALSPLALWLALRALDRRKRVDWIVYVAAAIITLYFYYLELFVVFVLNLFVLINYRRDRALLLRWFASQAAIGLVLVPWYFYVLQQILAGKTYGGTAGGFNPLLWFTDFLPTLSFGSVTAQQLQQMSPYLMWGLIVLLVAALFAGWWVLWRSKRRDALLLGLLGTVPLLLIAMVSLKLSVFVPRYVLSLTPVYLILAAVLLMWLWSKRSGWQFRGVFFAGCVVLLAIDANSLISYYFTRDYAKAPDWRSLVFYLQPRTAQNDLVLNTSADESFTLYHQDYSVSGEQWRFPANPAQSNAEIRQLLADNQYSHRSIWMIAQTFPDWPNAGIVESWLAEHMQRVRHTSVNGMRAEQYMPWEVEPIDQPPLATFGGLVELAAAEVLLPPEPTAELTVWLYWRPLAVSPTPLKVFVHLLGDTNPATGTPLWTQQDDFPQGGRISTTSWQPSVLYRDVYELPLHAIHTGEYSVSVGLYDPETLSRLETGANDSTIIATISLS